MATFTIDLLSGTALLLTGNFSSGGSTSSSWGSITGVLSGQTDLQNTLNTKLNISAFNNYTGNSTYYNLSSPATCTVGGINAGTVLTGKSAFEIIKEILAPELFGTLTSPSTSINTSPSGTFEIGCNISTLCVTSTFNRGSINPQYCSASSYRSGTANKYYFTGSQISGSYVCSGTSVIKCATNYIISGGSQSWGVCTSYNSGVQPKGSNGTNYNSPLPSGCTAPVSMSITGILPWYWGICVNQTLGSSDIVAGIKCIASASGTLPIIFNSLSTDYIWFAVPQGTAVKTCWYVSGINNGCIGGTGNLFATYCTIPVTSAQSCWSNCNYMVYVSCTPTGTAVGIPMCVN